MEMKSERRWVRRNVENAIKIDWNGADQNKKNKNLIKALHAKICLSFNYKFARKKMKHLKINMILNCERKGNPPTLDESKNKFF